MSRVPSVLLLVVALVVACAPADPRVRLLEERARWDVSLLSWAVAEADGSLRLSTRVQGPTSSFLERLTVRVDMLDAAGRTVASEWTTIDLGGIDRGGPEDVLIALPAPAAEVGDIEGLAIDTLVDPGPDDEPRIVELAELKP